MVSLHFVPWDASATTELQERVPPIQKLAESADDTFVMLNNDLAGPGTGKDLDVHDRVLP
jgi:hypothetical protein